MEKQKRIINEEVGQNMNKDKEGDKPRSTPSPDEIEKRYKKQMGEEDKDYRGYLERRTLEGKKEVDTSDIVRDLHLKRKAGESKKSTYSTEPKKLKIGNYDVEIRLPLESKNWIWERGRLQVNVTSKDGKEYYADFVTLNYIKEVMNKKFPELGYGNYFLGKNKVIIKNLKEDTVNNTLEDLLLNWKDTLEDFFEKR